VKNEREQSGDEVIVVIDEGNFADLPDQLAAAYVIRRRCCDALVLVKRAALPAAA
jgi:hypothetical protein